MEKWNGEDDERLKLLMSSAIMNNNEPIDSGIRTRTFNVMIIERPIKRSRGVTFVIVTGLIFI